MQILKYLGDGATAASDATGLAIFVPAAVLSSTGLLDDPTTATSDKLAIALLNILYSTCKDKGDDPTWLISSQSIFPGRSSIGVEAPQTFNTYDFSIQVRTPSGEVSELPDPDF